MIYRIFVSDGRIKSAEEVDTSSAGSSSMSIDQYLSNMKDILTVNLTPRFGKMPNGKGFNYYVEAINLAVAASKVDSVLLRERLRK